MRLQEGRLGFEIERMLYSTLGQFTRDLFRRFLPRLVSIVHLIPKLSGLIVDIELFLVFENLEGVLKELFLLWFLQFWENNRGFSSR